jgi:hypothetical protein
MDEHKEAVSCTVELQQLVLLRIKEAGLKQLLYLRTQQIDFAITFDLRFVQFFQFNLLQKPLTRSIILLFCIGNPDKVFQVDCHCLV